MNDDREFLTYEQAVAMLPPGGGAVHTYIEGRAGVLIGADWSRSDLLDALKKGKPQLAGPMASEAGHGMAVEHPNLMCWLFIYTGPLEKNHVEVSQESKGEETPEAGLRGQPPT